MRRRSRLTIPTIVVLGVFTLPYAAPAVCAALDPGMASMDGHVSMQAVHWLGAHPPGGCFDVVACGAPPGLLVAPARVVTYPISSPAMPAPALPAAGDPTTPPTPPPRS